VKARLARLAKRFEALERSRRLALVAGTAVALVAGVQLAAVDPLVAAARQARSEAAAVHKRIAERRGQLAEIKTRHEFDPDREERQRLARLEEEAGRLDERLRERMRGLIQPREMARVLEDVLVRRTRLRLETVRSLPPRPLVEPGPAGDGPRVAETDGTEAEAAARPAAGVWRHGLEITFHGTYLDTLAYLRELERLPWEFYWDGVVLEVEKYPRARVTITVHTLGLEEGWIGV